MFVFTLTMTVMRVEVQIAVDRRMDGIMLATSTCKIKLRASTSSHSDFLVTQREGGQQEEAGSSLYKDYHQARAGVHPKRVIRGTYTECALKCTKWTTEKPIILSFK